jgi:hypothetical protein
VRRAAERYASLAEKWGITPVELALCWARDRWFNAAIISGTCSLKQARCPLTPTKDDTSQGGHQLHRTVSDANSNW